MKIAADVLTFTLAKIINLSLKLSVFPEECEIAMLKPLFKKGSKTDSRNYRSISLVSVLFKFVEESKHYQADDYL